MAEEKNDRRSETEEKRQLRHEERRERRRKIKRRNSVIIAFVMALAMVVEITSVGLYMGFFSTGASKRLGVYIDEYLDSAYTVVLQRVEALSIKNGLPTTVYYDVLTEDRMRVTLESFVNDLSEKDASSETVTDDIKEAIIEKVSAHLKSTGVTIDEKVSANIVNYSEQCVKIYQNTLIFSHFRLIRQLKMYLFYAVVAVTIVCVTVIVICIVLLNRYLSHSRQILRYMIYAVGTSCLVTFVPSFLLYNRLIPIYLSNMQLKFQSDVIMNYFYNSFHYLMSVSYLLFAVYLILIGIWYYIATVKKGHI